MRLLLALIVFFAPWVFAHDARPVVVQINEGANGVAVRIKTPASIPAAGMPLVRVEAECSVLSGGALRHDPGAYVSDTLYRCNQSLGGAPLQLHYPYFNPSLSALVKVTLENGQTYTHLLGPEQTEWRIPSRESSAGVARQYVEMGALHIWQGWDHLLFVACLILLGRSMRKIAFTVTGFTLGHSVTLAAAALGYIRIRAELFESLIALSIVYLAVELARRNDDSWTHRYPAIVAASFGLLHGLGFASVLQEIGLPQTQLMWGLLSFNLGIELGQLAFVCLVIGVMWLARHVPMSEPIRKQLSGVTVFTLGTVASFWFWERTWPLFQ